MIEIPEMLTLIEIAVSERGENFRYADYARPEHGAYANVTVRFCQYRSAVIGTPLCIAGLALNEAGLAGNLLEGNTVTTQSSLVGKVSAGALGVLRAAQAAQDKGETWGDALKAARAEAEEHAS